MEKEDLEHDKAQGALLRQTRMALDLSQEKLAELAGVARQTVVRYEKGEIIKRDEARAISKVLGLRFRWDFANPNADNADLVELAEERRKQKTVYALEREQGLLVKDVFATFADIYLDPELPFSEEERWKHIRENVDRIREAKMAKLASLQGGPKKGQKP